MQERAAARYNLLHHVRGDERIDVGAVIEQVAQNTSISLRAIGTCHRRDHEHRTAEGVARSWAGAAAQQQPRAAVGTVRLQAR